MKKKIVILGSTGSIGRNTLSIIRKDIKNFDIILLSTNKNIKRVINQAKEFKVKNIIISDSKNFLKAKKKYKNLDINFFNSFSKIDSILKKKKVFYSMNSIIGMDGLKPSLKLIKYSKNIAIVNKEAIICGWNLIKKELIRFKTKFIPIDSEHFSIYSLMGNNLNKNIDKIFITASGGPFLKRSIKNLNQIKKKDALNHPNWKMGKKISIDSSTMMNKVFEVIEAKKIFDLKYKDISILTHPKSYVHAIVKFKNALTKILIHEPDMRIPIYNSLYSEHNSKIPSKNIDLKILNNLELKKVDTKRFPLTNLINKLVEYDSLYETVLITVNDFFVLKFLSDKIKYNEMIKMIYKYSNYHEFLKFRKIKPKNVEDIYKLRNYVSLKLQTLSV
ncbi:1-deoxy-D-xylulose 5-phosphate reductoisomerase [Candidatus Pelagibacter communis]|mgnify:CR=1 FL=1|uniref:1-deoxy-D-xylulose 5-phosphate reductoisomerase n=1 Tax=Pelagibacter ubique TaxID=198252 RepID=UPI00094C68FD|nr:1-deoxy-D-xylulose 5-phosphate reductoisomerase [Candidatus Pelagibacter ubique]